MIAWVGFEILHRTYCLRMWRACQNSKDHFWLLFIVSSLSILVDVRGEFQLMFHLSSAAYLHKYGDSGITNVRV